MQLKGVNKTAQLNKARAKFTKLDNLNMMSQAKGDEGCAGRQAKKALNQTWVKRDCRPGTMYKTKNAKKQLVRIVTHETNTVLSGPQLERHAA